MGAKIVSKKFVSNSEIHPLRDGEKIVGSFIRETGEVKFAKGTTVSTVIHGDPAGTIPSAITQNNGLFYFHALQSKHPKTRIDSLRASTR